MKNRYVWQMYIDAHLKRLMWSEVIFIWSIFPKFSTFVLKAIFLKMLNLSSQTESAI